MNFIHNSGLLHNDLKPDNVAIGTSVSMQVRPYIIDFGKACSVGCGKTYKLSLEEVAVYKQDHTHIAPDLRDGHTAQSKSTDAYSLGRIVRKLNRVVHSESVSSLARELLRYNSKDRPTLSDVISQLKEVEV